MDEQAAIRNFRDFLTVYNSFTEKCFNHCATNLNYRVLTPEEESCVDRCSSKLINVNHRVIGTYMEVNPMARMLAESQKQVEAGGVPQGSPQPTEDQGSNPGVAGVNSVTETAAAGNGVSPDIANSVPVQSDTNVEQNTVIADSQR